MEPDHPQLRRAGGALLAAVILVLAVLVVYAPVRRYGFNDFDDRDYLVENLHLRHGLTGESLRWAFTTFHAANWHPLTWVSHALDLDLFGPDPGAFHAVSVLLHLLATILLLLALRSMTGAVWPSALAASLFALHPLHVESVVWLAERKDVLLGLCWMLVLLGYIRYLRKPGALRWTGVVGLYALALLAKPMGVTLPFVLLLLDYWPLGRWGVGGKDRRRGSLARLVGEKIPLFLLAAASSVLTYRAQAAAGAVRLSETYPLSLRAANALVSYGRYLLRALWPSRLAVFYPYPRMVPGWQTLAAALFLAAAGWAVWRGRRRRPYLVTGWLWYLGMLVPVIGLIQVGEQAMADRYTYLPLIGVFIVAAWGLADLRTLRPDLRPAVTALAMAAMLALAVAAGFQVRLWRDDFTLFSHADRVTADNWMMAYNLGNTLSRRGDLAGARESYRKAIRIRPGYPQALNNLAAMLAREERHEEALPYFRRAVELQPAYALAWYNLGVMLTRMGRDPEAVDALRRAVAYNPEMANAHIHLGAIWQRLGRMAEARAAWETALRIDPENVTARQLLDDLKDAGRN